MILNKETKDAIVATYNELNNTDFKYLSEVLNKLNDEFRHNIEVLCNTQLAYFVLENQNNFFFSYINKYGISLSYSLTNNTKKWSVEAGESYKDSDEEKYIDIARKVYGKDYIEIIDDVFDMVEDSVTDVMSDEGCNVFNALELVMKKSLSELDKNVFMIENTSYDNTRIQIQKI